LGWVERWFGLVGRSTLVVGCCLVTFGCGLVCLVGWLDGWFGTLAFALPVWLVVVGRLLVYRCGALRLRWVGYVVVALLLRCVVDVALDRFPLAGCWLLLGAFVLLLRWLRWLRYVDCSLRLRYPVG